jgi:hypothetical protein
MPVIKSQNKQQRKACIFIFDIVLTCKRNFYYAL